MNIFFLSMSPKQAARWHANIHIVKMIVETAQLLCNVHRRKREHCLPPYPRGRIPYKESAAGHRKLGSMIWIAESLGNYRWGVQLGLALCDEYNKGRGRASGKTSKHRTQKVLEWLRDHEPNFSKKNRTPVKHVHLAMPDKFKKAPNSVEAYRDYYYSKRKTMEMKWPPGRTPLWWIERQSPKKFKEIMEAKDNAKALKGKKREPVASVASETPVLPSRKRESAALDSIVSEGVPSESVPSRRLRRKTQVSEAQHADHTLPHRVGAPHQQAEPSHAMAAISEGEVAVYDRQLRLWGVQAQQRLLQSKVLIWGLEGCNVEVCKNLALAGISLTIRDHRVAGLADIGFNYFLRGEDEGKNRAECAARSVQEMNPLCSVSASAAGPEQDKEKLSQALKGFDLVILGLGVLDWSVDLAVTVDAICRDAGAGFMLTVGSGEMAFFFSDLNEHEMLERSSAQGGGGGGGANGSATPAKSEPEKTSFPSFSEWLDCAPADLTENKVDASIVFVSLFFSFIRQHGAKQADAAKFEGFCRDIAKCSPVVDGVTSFRDAYANFFCEPLMHVVSIVGGLLAQEVIKAITKRDPPMVNTVCFNAFTSAALVERIPAGKKAAVKRKVEEAFDLDD